VAPGGPDKGEEKGVGEVVNDLWQLCRDYAKQETIDPLKSIGRFVGWGIGGALLLGLGLCFGALAVVRLLQTQTGDTFDGNWSFVPYLAALVFTTVAVGLSVAAIKRPLRAEEDKR
jgi:hypothetical protein